MLVLFMLCRYTVFYLWHAGKYVADDREGGGKEDEGDAGISWRTGNDGQNNVPNKACMPAEQLLH